MIDLLTVVLLPQWTPGFSAADYTMPHVNIVYYCIIIPLQYTVHGMNQVQVLLITDAEYLD